MSAGLTFRLVDVVTGDVLLTQYLDTFDLAALGGEYGSDVAVDHAERTGHGVALQALDDDGDVLPAGEWVELRRVEVLR
jgi:hypothetical protein